MKLKLTIDDGEEEFFANAEIEGAEQLPPDTVTELVGLTIDAMRDALKNEMLEMYV